MDAIQVVWSPLLPGPRQVWHLQETRHTRPRCKCLRLRMLLPSGKVKTVRVDAHLAGKMKDTQVCQCQWSLNNLVLIQTLWTKIVPNFYPQIQCIWRRRWFFKVASAQSCTRITNRRTKTYTHTDAQEYEIWSYAQPTNQNCNSPLRHRRRSKYVQFATWIQTCKSLVILRDFHRILHCHGYTFFSLDMCEIYALEIKRIFRKSVNLDCVCKIEKSNEGRIDAVDEPFLHTKFKEQNHADATFDFSKASG